MDTTKKIHSLDYEEKENLKNELSRIFKKINLTEGDLNNQSLNFLIYFFHSKYPGLFNQETKVLAESGDPNPEILFVTNTPNTQFIDRVRPEYKKYRRKEGEGPVSSMKKEEIKFIENEIKRTVGYIPVISYYHYFPNRFEQGIEPGIDDYNLFVYFLIKKIQISKPKIILIASSQIFFNLKKNISLNLINEEYKPFLKFNDEFIELYIPNESKQYRLYQVVHPWVVMKGEKEIIKKWNNQLNLSLERFKPKEKFDPNEIMKNGAKTHFKKSIDKKNENIHENEEEKSRRIEIEEKMKERDKKKEKDKKKELVEIGKKNNGKLISDFFQPSEKISNEEKFKKLEDMNLNKKMSEKKLNVKIQKKRKNEKGGDSSS
jgi:hypothetical protein